MRLQVLEIEPIQQPAELLVVEFNDSAFEMERPPKSLFFEPLQPQAETRALPVKNLDLVFPFVDEAKQIAAERIVFQRRLDEHREPVDAHPEVNGFAA